MKKLILILIVAFTATIFNSCTENTPVPTEKKSQTLPLRGENAIDLAAPYYDDSLEKRLNTEMTAIEQNKAISKSKEIPVGEKNFKKLVAFIEKNGFVVPQQGVPCDYQYTFFDSHGNRHALITIKRDKDGHPSINGTVSHISIWAYYKGIKDQDHYFGYGITSEKVAPFILDLDGTWKDADAVKFGYEEFLAKVLK